MFDNPLKRFFCLSRFVFIKKSFGSQEGCLGRQCGARELILQVAERSGQKSQIALLAGFFKGVKQHSCLSGLTLLPIVPTIPSSKTHQGQSDQTGNEVSPPGPKGFDLIELLLFFKVEMRSHDFPGDAVKLKGGL